MATGYLILPPKGATLPDGSGSGNAPAIPIFLVSTGTQPTNASKVTLETFGLTSTEQHLSWSFALPTDYISGGKVRIKWVMQTAVAGNVNLKAAAAVANDGVTDLDAIVYDTVVTSGAIAVPTTAGQPTDTLLTLTMLNASAGRWISVMIGSEGTGWTAAGTLVLASVMFEYVR